MVHNSNVYKLYCNVPTILFIHRTQCSLLKIKFNATKKCGEYKKLKLKLKTETHKTPSNLSLKLQKKIDILYRHILAKAVLQTPLSLIKSNLTVLDYFLSITIFWILW